MMLYPRAFVTPRVRAVAQQTITRGFITDTSFNSSHLNLEEPWPSTLPTTPKLPRAPVTTVSTLSNGLQVVSRETQANTASIGLLVGCGSCDEGASGSGSALLLQNAAFKSTTERSALRLNRDMELAGVSACASGGREHMLYSAVCLSDRVGVAVSAIGETAINPRFSKWELDDIKKKTAAVDLIDFYGDGTALLNEAIHAAAFEKESPLGHSYFSSTQSDVDISDFASRFFTTGSMVLAGNGVSHAELVAHAEASALGSANQNSVQARAASPYVGGEFRVPASSPLTYIAVAVKGPEGQKGKAATSVLKKALQARVSVEPYEARAFSHSFTDNGLVGYCAAVDNASAGSVAKSLASILTGFGKSPITSTELKEAKLAALISHLTACEEPSIGAGLLALGVNGANYNDLDIESISNADLKLGGPLSVAVVGDIASVPRIDAL
eukprot:475972_1